MLRVIAGLFLSTVARFETVDSNVVMTYGKDGYLSNIQPTQTLSPSDRVSYIESLGYPKAPFKKLRQSWSWASISEIPETKSAVKINCSDIRFSQGTCEESSLKLKDGDEEIVYCGDKAVPFTIVSKSEELSAFLTVGPKGHVYLKCTASAIHLDSNREELTTSKPSYLVEESVEVDSEEHGGAEGDKTTTCPCGWANKMSSRIVNGSVTNPNEFPFVVALVDKDDLWQFCGATIITTWHALTAAHCTIDWREREPMALLVGQHNIYDGTTKGSQMIDVVKIVEHEGYSPEHYVYDISLLVLKQEIVLSAKVGPACLPTHQYNLAKKYVKVIGWGLTKWKGERSDLLRKVDVRVVDRKECGAIYPMVKNLKNKHLCTYANKKSPCKGDSGSSVVWVDPETNRYTLVGIVSFVNICADEWPTVHTDVAAFLDWIQSNVQETKPSAKMCYKEE